MDEEIKKAIVGVCVWSYKMGIQHAIDTLNAEYEEVTSEKIEKEVERIITTKMEKN